MSTELLCSVSDVSAAWPGFTAIASGEQASLIATASRRIHGHCRRGQFAQAMEIETLDGTGLSRVWLRRTPVITIASVTINGIPIDNTTGYGWGVNSRTGELFRGDGSGNIRFRPRFPIGRQNIVVEYWAGYTDIPEPVNRAAIWMVRWIQAQGLITGIYSSESIGDWSGTLNTAGLLQLGLPGHITALLVDYVRHDGPL